MSSPSESENVTPDAPVSGASATSGTLSLPASVYAEIVALAYDCYPDEACGLIAGHPAPPTDAHAGVTSGATSGVTSGITVTRFYPCRNAAESARVYTIEPRDHLRAERDAEDNGWEIVGVVHSHTHTEPYPSPTDVAQAPDPTWQYVIVSLKRATPEVRSYRIVDGHITDTPVTVL